MIFFIFDDLSQKCTAGPVGANLLRYPGRLLDQISFFGPRAPKTRIFPLLSRFSGISCNILLFRRHSWYL